MKIIAVIPAYDSADPLSLLLPAAKAQLSDIVVVDDGSTDETSLVSSREGVEVIRHGTNRGKGAALKIGFAYALENSCDLIITLDSDGQHEPKYIPLFLQAYNKSGADLIIGSRAGNKGDMPWDRRFSNRITSSILTLLLRKNIEDSQCGYRLISRRLLESINLESEKFELETEMIIKAVKAGFDIHYLPINVRYGKTFPTHISRLADTLRWCRKVFKLSRTKSLQSIEYHR